jgi:type IV pilus assembly protein PilW
MGIMLFIMVGVVQLMVDNRQKFQLGKELAFIQENARFVLEELGYDLRLAGYTGCGQGAKVANLLNGSDTGFYGNSGVEGWDGLELASDFPSQYSGDLWAVGTAAAPDSIMIRRLNIDNEFISSDSMINYQPAATVGIYGTHDIEPGTIMILTKKDCSQVMIFQESQTMNPGMFVVNTGSAVSPGNCRKAKIHGNGTCSDTSDFTDGEVEEGATVTQFVSNAYYIASSSIDPSVPALYRESLGIGTTRAEELLIGVESMKFAYGVDTDADVDGVADRYVSANQITGSGNLEWGRVVSVQIDVLLRSLDRVWPESTTFTFDGQNYTDRFLRQRISSTILLRNMVAVY